MKTDSPRKEDGRPSLRNRLAFAILLSVFLGSASFLIYMVVSGWLLGYGESTMEFYLSGGISAVSLFLFREVSYRRNHHPAAAHTFAFLDTLAFYSATGLAIWGFVFPFLKPFPPDLIMYPLYLKSLPVNVYTLMFGWALIVIIRVAAQPVINLSLPTGFYDDVRESLKRLATFSSESQNRPIADGGGKDDVLLEKISRITAELAAIREDLSSIKNRSVVSLARTIETSAGRVSTLMPATSRAEGEEALAVVTTRVEGARKPIGSIPDSAVDNPWIDVLSRRRQTVRRQEAAQ